MHSTAHSGASHSGKADPTRTGARPHPRTILHGVGGARTARINEVLRVDACINTAMGVSMVTVFIVASIRILEETLRDAISRPLSFNVVGDAADAPAALLAIQDLDRPPDIVLVDVYASHSIDTTRLIATALPSVRVVCFGLGEEPGEVINWAEAGVAGFVSSRATLDDLVHVL